MPKPKNLGVKQQSTRPVIGAQDMSSVDYRPKQSLNLYSRLLLTGVEIHITTTQQLNLLLMG
jgi:hypothetical protein